MISSDSFSCTLARNALLIATLALAAPSCSKSGAAHTDAAIGDGGRAGSDAASEHDASQGRDAAAPHDAASGSDAGAGGADAGNSPCATSGLVCAVPHTHCDGSSGAATCVCDVGFAIQGDGCVEVAASLSGLRWELPCGMRTSAELCRTRTARTQVEATMMGAPDTMYEVRFRVRGVIEPKTYTGAVGSGHVVTGGTPAADTANIYRLSVSDPPQTLYVNAGMTRASTALYCETVDDVGAIAVRAGAVVTLAAETIDSLQIVNRAADGSPFVVDGVPPAPEPFDGQFVQLDVTSVLVVRP